MLGIFQRTCSELFWAFVILNFLIYTFRFLVAILLVESKPNISILTVSLFWFVFWVFSCFVTTVRFYHILFVQQQPHWFHYKCFFVKNKPKIISDIKGVNELRWDDAQKIKAVFGITSPSASASTSASTASSTTLPALDFANNIEKDYRVEYAKSNRSKCKECGEKIEKLELRLAIMVDGDLKFTSDKIPNWHHVACFKVVKQDTPEMAGLLESDFQGRGFRCCGYWIASLIWSDCDAYCKYIQDC